MSTEEEGDSPRKKAALQELRDKANKFTVTIEGFTSMAQAEAFYHWYEGQGEQDITVWLEISKDRGEIDVDSLNVVSRSKRVEDNNLIFAVNPS